MLKMAPPPPRPCCRRARATPRTARATPAPRAATTASATRSPRPRPSAAPRARRGRGARRHRATMSSRRDAANRGNEGTSRGLRASGGREDPSRAIDGRAVKRLRRERARRGRERRGSASRGACARDLECSTRCRRERASFFRRGKRTVARFARGDVQKPDFRRNAKKPRGRQQRRDDAHNDDGGERTPSPPSIPRARACPRCPIDGRTRGAASGAPRRGR